VIAQLSVRHDPPRSAAENMAIDEQLLATATEPTLRFYHWDPPALSLGRFQDAEDAPALPEGADQIRRVTGGGAIYHDTGELTFSLVLPREAHPWAAKPVRLYAATNRVWRLTFRELGLTVTEASACSESDPFLCFDRRERTDLLYEGRKLLGSAQRRTADRVLIHGSLPLAPNPLAAGAISLGEALDREIAPKEVVDLFCRMLTEHGLAPGVFFSVPSLP